MAQFGASVAVDEAAGAAAGSLAWLGPFPGVS